MGERVPSDHPSIRTIRTTVARHGASRPRLDVPSEEADAVPEGEVIRLVVEEVTYFARVDGGFADESPRITGAYDSPAMARSGDGENRLEEWFEESGRSFGSSVLLDVIEPDFAYGIREPGETVVYEAVEAPKSSLADIARDLDG
ncbi:DUF7112 family protein [Natronorarus salvus]|uniref:DUF7112 family protein n=1 Tax=Natronorarus salvus TaxID=3117733 RepID=UPI002F265669